jgi:hypothetical protein
MSLDERSVDLTRRTLNCKLEHSLFWAAVALALVCQPAASPVAARALPDQPAEGFAIDLPNSEEDVVLAVQTVVNDHIIRGTYVYEREKILNGAVAETASTYFSPGSQEGRVFYKVRRNALAPRNFKDSSDIGVITVRYIVRPTSTGRTHLEILAVFVEDGTHRLHRSNSTVETSEFTEIQKQLEQMQKDRMQAEETQQKKSLEAEKASALVRQQDEETSRYRATESSLQTLEERANQLQHALEVRVPAENTELKAAPFHSAAALAKLPANSDVLVEIITTYWYGVETTDGHRGWLRRDQVVSIP